MDTTGLTDVVHLPREDALTGMMIWVMSDVLTGEYSFSVFCYLQMASPPFRGDV